MSDAALWPADDATLWEAIPIAADADVCDAEAVCEVDFWPMPPAAPQLPPQGRCAWLSGDPYAFRFCRERAQACRPYCKAHESASRVRHLPRVRLAPRPGEGGAMQREV
jgi:hypothetical protein